MWLSMNTNGGARDVGWWKELAKVLKKPAAVIFSVDGLADTNHLYRQGVVWDHVEQNMRAFIEAGGRARWDFIVFDHNQHQVDEARLLSERWGVERFVVKKTGRIVGINLRPHDLRRHAATYASRSGTPLEIVSKIILRHANLATTQRYLGKVSDVEAMRWIENLHG